MSEAVPPYRPTKRPREQRYGQAVRDRYADVTLGPEHLVMPLFVREGERINQPVASMPGVSRMSPDVACEAMRGLAKRGLKRFIFFGVVDARKKDATGSAALDKDNPVNRTLRRARDAGIEAELIADLCLCEYTDHGHCGVLHENPEIMVDNDATLELLGRQATVLAESGAHIVAPSGMMDGMVGAVRAALDGANFPRVKILSYAVKYASAFYGPFREAGEGAPRFGDRRAYQMDYRRSDEWKLEVELDLKEGADAVMVKPAIGYLDIIRQVRGMTDKPVAAFHVSGEYSMLHAAADRGWVELKAAALEHTCAIRRAGADWVLTYFAPQLLDWMEG